MTDIDSLKKELDLAFPTKTPQQEKVFAEMDVESKKQEYANKLKMPSAPSSGGFLDTTKIKSEPGLRLETPNFNVDEIFSKTNSGEYIAKFDTYTPGIDNYDKFSREKELELIGEELNLKNIALTFVPSVSDVESEMNLNKINPIVVNTFIIYRHRTIIDKFIDLIPTVENFAKISTTLDKTRSEYFNLSEPSFH